MRILRASSYICLNPTSLYLVGQGYWDNFSNLVHFGPREVASVAEWLTSLTFNHLTLTSVVVGLNLVDDNMWGDALSDPGPDMTLAVDSNIEAQIWLLEVWNDKLSEGSHVK